MEFEYILFTIEIKLKFLVVIFIKISFWGGPMLNNFELPSRRDSYVYCLPGFGRCLKARQGMDDMQSAPAIAAPVQDHAHNECSVEQ